MRSAVIAAGLLLASSCAVLAQTNSAESAAKPAAPEKADEPSMEEPQVGDHWTYSLHDEITGAEKFVVTITVADVSPNDITTRFERTGGSTGTGYTIFDHSWNVKENSTWKYSPNDGTGVKLPLKVGLTWPIHGHATAHGNSNRRAGNSKVVGEETVTTSAGSFDTFKVETTLDVHLPKDPSKKIKLMRTAWYAPSVDHWVKVESKTTINGHVTAKTSLALVDYGRR